VALPVGLHPSEGPGSRSDTSLRTSTMFTPSLHDPHICFTMPWLAALSGLATLRGNDVTRSFPGWWSGAHGSPDVAARPFMLASRYRPSGRASGETPDLGRDRGP